MKIILPSLAAVALTAGWAIAQTQPSQRVSPPLSIRPPDVPASYPSGNFDGATGGPTAPANGFSNLPGGASTNSAATVPANQGYNAASLGNAVPVTNAAPLTNTQLTNTVPQPGAADPNGVDLFMERVVGAGEQWPSVEARIRYHANLFGQQIVGTGLYLQSGAGDDRKFRLELKTAIGQQLMTLQQICDGKYLWQFQDAPDKAKSDADNRPTINRIDLRKVRQLLADNDPNFHDNMALTNFAGQLTWGGLPKLLGGLQSSFRFNRVEAGKLDPLPVWVAAGTWRPEVIGTVSKNLANQAAREQPFDLKLLPPQLPEQVWLYVGQDDFFPYRIEYRRRSTQGRGGGAAKDDMSPIVTVEFYEVRLGTPINPREFDYQPGDASVVDSTDGFVKNLLGANSTAGAAANQNRH